MHNKPSHRGKRLEEQILHELADIIYHKVKDPRLGFITLTEVQLSKDNQHATVYYTVMQDKDKERSSYALESSRGFIRSELAHRLNVYKVPTLSFHYDSSVEHGAVIENLLQKIHQEQESNDAIENDSSSKESTP
jgi:ribosome-binding factor A